MVTNKRTAKSNISTPDPRRQGTNAKSARILELANKAVEMESDGMEELENVLRRFVEANETTKQVEAIAAEFESLLERNPSEEAIHSFLATHTIALGQTRDMVRDRKIVEGVLSKFKVAPDRIPDFTLASFQVGPTQHPNRLIFFELKKPDSSLFVGHNRLSRDLNDAWMESVDTLRIVGLNYRDVLRRITASLGKNYVKDFEKYYSHIAKLELNEMYHSVPRCSCVIVIGRRKSLNSEDLLRIRELGASTNWVIKVSTYDSILDDLRENRRRPFYW